MIVADRDSIPLTGMGCSQNLNMTPSKKAPIVGPGNRNWLRDSPWYW